MRQPAEPRPTPSGPLRIFLSSTSVDLEPYRTRVATLIRRMGQFAAVMDNFPLTPTKDATSASLDELRASNLYILLLAWRYGTIPEGHALSVTHEEYREARRIGLPCYVFLADEGTRGDEKAFPRDQEQSEPSAQVLAFRQEVHQQLVGTFTSQDDLVDRVAAALTQYLLEQGRPARIPRDLPPAVSGFVGRERELSGLLGLLRAGQPVQVSALLAGLGGVGKSALAAETLRRVAGDPTAFPGGITWVRCNERSGLEGLTSVYDQMLAAWGVRLTAEALRGIPSDPEAQAEAREQALRDRLARLPGPALALLDNVEVDFPLERALETLQPLGITLLVTARHRPGLPGLRVLPLDVLDPDAAVALFAERYTDKGGVWDAARDEAAARTVVEALGRLALAIELAAARAALTGLGARGLADEVRRPDVLAKLADPLRDEASVRYSFGRSLEALSPAQRVRFAALGLPAGTDWPRPAIEALFAAVPPPASGPALFAASSGAGAGSAGADLERLAALSLVGLFATSPAAEAATEGASGPDDAGELVIRVRLHPLLRWLAEEAWAREPAATRSAGVAGLMEGVLAWVQAHRTRDARTYALLEADEPLVVGALRAALEAGLAASTRAGGRPDSETQRLLDAVVSTAFALMDYLLDGGHWQVGVEVWELALRAVRATGDRGNEGVSLGTLGLLTMQLGYYARARQLYEQGLAISREVGDRQGESAKLGNLGELARRTGDFARARQLYEQSLTIIRQRDDRTGEADTLNSLGILSYQQRDYPQARCYYEQALPLYREVGYRAGEANTLGNLAELATAEGELAHARTCLHAALPLARASGNRGILCFILIELGELARSEQCWADADRWLDEAEALNRQLGSREKEANALAARARLRRNQGQPEQARPLFARALAIFAALGDAFETQRVRTELAALDAPESASPPAQATHQSGAAPAAAAVTTGKPKRRRIRWPWG